MLTDQEQQALAGMSREELVKLWILIQQVKAERLGCMPPSAVQDLVKAVPDKLCQEIVRDLRGGRAEPGWLPPAGSPAKERGTGWQKPTELGRSDLKWIDRAMDVQDALDKAERVKGLGAVFGGGPRVLGKDDVK